MLLAARVGLVFPCVSRHTCRAQRRAREHRAGHRKRGALGVLHRCAEGWGQLSWECVGICVWVKRSIRDNHAKAKPSSRLASVVRDTKDTTTPALYECTAVADTSQRLWRSRSCTMRLECQWRSRCPSRCQWRHDVLLFLRVIAHLPPFRRLGNPTITLVPTRAHGYLSDEDGLSSERKPGPTVLLWLHPASLQFPAFLGPFVASSWRTAPPPVPT